MIFQTKIKFLFRVLKLTNTKKIFICCTEQSGENICYNVLSKIKKENFIINGVAGKKSEKYLNHKFFDISDFNAMGIVEVLININKYLKKIKFLTKEVLNNNYDLVICIDSPDFNYILAKKIKEKGFDKKIIQIVAPSVWAWRKNRAKKFSMYFDEILTLFKFENKYFTKFGLKSSFVGHPIYYISKIEKSFKNKKYISFLPGSRETEINKLFPYYQGAYEYLIEKKLKFKIFIPTLSHLENIIKEKTKNWKIETIITTDSNIIDNLFNQTFLSVTCSGTATLELAKKNIPQLIIYKFNFLTAIIAKLFVNVRYANLINIISNKMIIPELTNFNLTKKNFLEEFNKLLQIDDLRITQIYNINLNLKHFEADHPPYEKITKRIMNSI